MTARRLVTRRLLLKDMGKAGVAVMILGAAACTTDSAAETTTTNGASGDGNGTSSTATSTTAAASTTAGPASSGYRFHRVDLDFVSAYLLHRNGEAVVVDTGVDGSSDAIMAGLAEIGLSWGDVGGVIITHHHGDHQGSLPEVLRETAAPWYAGAEDMGQITADNGIPVGDGDSVLELDVVSTPGHTPGHISVIDAAGGILIAGDALNGTDGSGVAGPNPRFTPDMGTANESVAKLAGYDYEVALFGHGEPLLSGASSAVAVLAESL